MPLERVTRIFLSEEKQGATRNNTSEWLISMCSILGIFFLPFFFIALLGVETGWISTESVSRKWWKLSFSSVCTVTHNRERAEDDGGAAEQCLRPQIGSWVGRAHGLISNHSLGWAGDCQWEIFPAARTPRDNHTETALVMWGGNKTIADPMENFD